MDTILEEQGQALGAGVRQIDAAGRRWYTRSFKQAVVAACLVPGASVARIAVDHGLNPNLVRKWLERARCDAVPSEPAMQFVPVIAAPDVSPGLPVPSRPIAGYVIEVQCGDALVRVAADAPAPLVRAVVAALR